MSPVLSAEGEKINWVNYKTGVKFIRFTMQSINSTATITIELSNADIVTQQQQFNRLVQFKNQFIQECGNDWRWQKMTTDKHDKIVSSISTSIENVSILNKSEWPKIISFFKPHLISLDKFWSNYKFALQQ